VAEWQEGQEGQERQRRIARPGGLVVLLCLAAMTHAPRARAQSSAPTTAPLRVFLDCQGMRCDFDYVRREITWVSWVRNRDVADIHVLGTDEHTGGGGHAAWLAFIGSGRFEGRVDTLHFSTPANATDDARRDELVRVLALGLAAFAAATPAGEHLSVSYQGPEAAATLPVHDPWSHWVFRTRLNGSASGQSQQRSYSLHGSVSATHVTEALKASFGAYARYSHDSYDVTDPDTTYINVQKNYSLDGELVGSLGPHWSLGGEAGVSRSTFTNKDLAIQAGPELEYDIYPYGESSRREITFKYTIALATYRYADTTLFDRLSETHPLQQLEIGAAFDQPWGSIYGSVSASQYLYDLSKHRIQLFGSVDLRLYQGLSLSLFGSVARIKDQIYLPKAGLTEADVLLQRRQLGTDFQYDASIGFSYTFGSIFNSVVNTRMNGVRGF